MAGQVETMVTTPTTTSDMDKVGLAPVTVAVEVDRVLSASVPPAVGAVCW